MAKAKKKSTGTRYNLINELHTALGTLMTSSRTGEVKIKRTDLKKAIEEAFEEGARRAAKGERVRFPIIGALVRRDVKSRKAGKGTNPFTGEAMTIKARPESKKPRWSFPKNLKETFSNKRNWS